MIEQAAGVSGGMVTGVVAPGGGRTARSEAQPFRGHRSCVIGRAGVVRPAAAVKG